MGLDCHCFLDFFFLVLRWHYFCWVERRLQLQKENDDDDDDDDDNEDNGDSHKQRALYNNNRGKMEQKDVIKKWSKQISFG